SVREGARRQSARRQAPAGGAPAGRPRGCRPTPPAGPGAGTAADRWGSPRTERRGSWPPRPALARGSCRTWWSRWAPWANFATPASVAASPAPPKRPQGLRPPAGPGPGWAAPRGGGGCVGRHADVVFTGGAVYTADPARRRVVAAGTGALPGTGAPSRAVAVRGDRIVAVGEAGGQDIAGLIGPRTEVVDLRGRALLPGFQDAHV